MLFTYDKMKNQLKKIQDKPPHLIKLERLKRVHTLESQMFYITNYPNTRGDLDIDAIIMLHSDYNKSYWIKL